MLGKIRFIHFPDNVLCLIQQGLYLQPFKENFKDLNSKLRNLERPEENEKFYD